MADALSFSPVYHMWYFPSLNRTTGLFTSFSHPLLSLYGRQISGLDQCSPSALEDRAMLRCGRQEQYMSNFPDWSCSTLMSNMVPRSPPSTGFRSYFTQPPVVSCSSRD